MQTRSKNVAAGRKMNLQRLLGKAGQMMGLGEKESNDNTDHLCSETTKELRKLFTNIPMCSSQPSLYQQYYPKLTYKGIKTQSFRFTRS